MSHLIKKACCALLSAAVILTCVLPASAAATTGNGSTAMALKLSDAFDKEAITYSRILCLKNNGGNNGTLLVTGDQHSWVNGEQVWPIYRSIDGGTSWAHITDVKDATFGTNRKGQPMLYELPRAVGSLPAGTLLLAGNLVPDNKSSTRIVVYKSIDMGASWTYMSTVDTGGPFDYDRSPSSTTSTIWEPFLYLDSKGRLVCAYSDEREKSDNVLQALVLRYSSDGISWSTKKNVVAIGNSNDRPGMITVTQLPNGKFFATYEVVNKPNYTINSAPTYCKFSDDGVTWNANDLGTLVKTADGYGLGSSPYVKWVNAGGPNGMVIVGSKWALDQNGNIQDGGQNFLVNYNLGQGNWERLPQPLSWNAADATYLDGFSQCIDTNAQGTVLYESANIYNPSSKSCEIRVGTLPLTGGIYEAENASLTDCSVRTNADSSNGREVGYINNSTSSVNFTDVKVPVNGTYTVNVRYNNGSGAASSHSVSVNGTAKGSVSYPITTDWNRYQWASFNCTLNAGVNSIKLSYNGTHAEVDCILVSKSGQDISPSFMLKNRNSGKFLEVPSMSTADATALQQYGATGYSCQIWKVSASSSGQYCIIANKNSGKLCEIYKASTANGAAAVQGSPSGNYSQEWSLSPTNEGYFHVVNHNSGKFLEVAGNSTADGASVNQWENTGYPCQEWTLVKEGIQ